MPNPTQTDRTPDAEPAPRPGTGRQSLPVRVRGLLGLFTFAVAGVYTLQLLVEQPAGAVPAHLAAVPTALLAAWAVVHYRQWPRWLTDPLLVVALAGLALTVPTEGWIWGPAYLVVFQRGLDAGRTSIWLWSLVSFTAYQGAVARLEGLAEVVTLNTVSTLTEYLVATLIVRILARALRAQEISWRREHILGLGSSRLLSAESEDEVAEVAARTAWELADATAATAGVWRALGDGHYHPAATVGPPIPAADEADLGTLPRLSTTAPVVVDGETVCVIVLGNAGTVPDDLLEVLLRFANEVASAWQRIGLVARLREANDELRLAAELKDQFVSTVSHELRTPLTSVIGFVDVLRRGWDRLDDDRKREFLDSIATQAHRQREMVEDLLSMSQILGNHLTVVPAPVDVEVAVHAALALVDLQAAVVAVPQVPPGWVDPRHLEQILTNLLTNADKYGDPPFDVAITAAGDDGIRIAVSDHGPGVAPDFVGRLFERFSQANSGPQHSAAGFGLGLAISAELAHANGAGLTYEPTPGGGATFVVEVPALRASAVDDAPAEPAGAQPA